MEDVTGTACDMFCPPRGRYGRRHVRMIREAGFIGMRSVELGNLKGPYPVSGLMVMPTSVQAYPHTTMALSRNAARRGAVGAIWRCIRQGLGRDWPRICSLMLVDITGSGGVFHLWGHSWELDETEQWERLDEVLNMLSQFAGRAQLLTNGQVCRSWLSPDTVASGRTACVGILPQ